MDVSMLRAWGVAVVGGIAFGCGLDPFGCADASDCIANGADGVCESSGFCSFPDDDCESGRRYGELAGDDLAGECVDDMAASGSGDGSTGGGPTTGESNSGDPSLTMSASASMSGGTTMTSTSPTSGVGESSDTGGVDTTDGVLYPEYGPCNFDSDCIAPGAVCRFNGGNGVCTPPCEINGVPATDCPLADPFVVGCLDTGTGVNACFIWCDGGNLGCPPGMDCVGNSCAWAL